MGNVVGDVFVLLVDFIQGAGAILAVTLGVGLCLLGWFVYRALLAFPFFFLGLVFGGFVGIFTLLLSEGRVGEFSWVIALGTGILFFAVAYFVIPYILPAVLGAFTSLLVFGAYGDRDPTILETLLFPFRLLFRYPLEQLGVSPVYHSDIAQALFVGALVGVLVFKFVRIGVILATASIGSAFLTRTYLFVVAQENAEPLVRPITNWLFEPTTAVEAFYLISILFIGQWVFVFSSIDQAFWIWIGLFIFGVVVQYQLIHYLPRRVDSKTTLDLSDLSIAESIISRANGSRFAFAHSTRLFVFVSRVASAFQHIRPAHAEKLINDTRYRAYTFQVIAMIVLFAAIAYLLSNLFDNLEQAGLNISYQFLGEPAGYDINQRLVEYDSQSTHLRATIVGVLNTLLVAFLACLTATIFGVIAGVLRLSNNWLVSKLMAWYVEAFRNVPVLIWIIIIFTIMIAVMPAPRAFRGDEPESTMLLGLFAFTNRGVYVPAPILTSPLFGSVAMGWLLVLVGLIGSFFGARTLSAWATAKQEATGERPVTWYFMLAIWFVPLIALLTIMGLTWDVPALRGFNFSGGMTVRGSLIALWFALAIYTGAFIAENVRAGIQAISKGQTEAAASLGLRPGRIMNLVILPQALRVIIPPLISQYLNITKNSSLAIAVGYMDITGTLGGITLNQTGRAIECVLLLMLFYLTISLLISAVMNVYNNSVKLKER